MNQTIWKQTDSRWAKKAYPSGSTVGGCGCGLLACTHIAMEQESKKNWTPDNLRSWMVSKGFALRGQGTRWEGITETLKHIGHKSVVRIYSDPMSEAWKELNKGNRIGVLLFNSRTAPNGVRWTASGHYVAFTGYKVQNGKHYFYTKDSGGRNHSGWYTYENSMKGCIAKLWIVERVGKQTNGSAETKPASSVSATTYKPTTAYKGSLPTSVVKSGSKGASVKAVQTFLNWCINAKLTVDSVAGAKTVNAIKVYQKTYGLTVDGAFGSASKAKAQSIIKQHKAKASWVDNANAWARDIAKQKYHYVKFGNDTKSQTCPICKGRKYDNFYGWNCIGFAYAVWHHGGKLGTKCNCGVVYDGLANKLLKATQANANKMASDRIGKNVSVIRNGGKAIPLSMLKAGDICMLYKGSSYYHTIYYMGNGKYAESNPTGGIGSAKNIRADLTLSSTAKANLKCAVRYAGK